MKYKHHAETLWQLMAITALSAVACAPSAGTDHGGQLASGGSAAPLVNAGTGSSVDHAGSPGVTTAPTSGGSGSLPAAGSGTSEFPIASSSGSAGSAGVASSGAAGSAGSVAANGGGTLPCDVTKALINNCQKCHGATPAFGAPMSLVSYADLTAPAKTDASLKVYQKALMRLNDAANPMPPGGMISAADKQTLTTWLSGGAQPAAADAVTCDTSGTVAPRDISYWKNGLTPMPGETCYNLPVHNGQTVGDMTPYDVSTGEHYEQFYFKVPWTDNEVMTRFGGKMDNLAVVHHWLLFTSNQADSKVGTHETTIGTTLGDSSQLIAGWAVGGDNVTFPSNTGLELTSQGILNAQWHYNNTTGAATTDASMIQVCTVPRSMRPDIASLTFLGTENFNGPIGMPAKTMSSFSGTCPNDSNAPITIFGFTPHMHKLGRHMNTVVKRAATGNTETVFDKAFDFNSQITYILDTPIVLQPNDTITSTCTFDNETNAAVPFGPSTTQEMCYNFTMSYPAKALDDGVLSLIGATNTCW